MPHVPFELLTKIGSYLPPLSLKKFSKIFNYKSDTSLEVWDAIFQDEEWATLVTTRLGLDLILLGVDLQQPPGPNTHILLGCTSSKENMLDLSNHSAQFQKSLKPHKLCEGGTVKLLD